MIEINPLNVLNQRKVNWIPPHFTKIKLSEGDSNFLSHWNKDLESWIDYRLKGRYGIVVKPTTTGTSTFVGFEDEKELTYFMLACPHI
jgi:hypothetical protein